MIQKNALINTDVFYEEWLGVLLVESHYLIKMKVNKMKRKYEILLNRIKEYIIESGPVTSAQIHEWYIENYGVKQAPTRNSIASTLRMYGKTIEVVGKRTHRSAVYSWEGEK